jgi:hypothetical protein
LGLARKLPAGYLKFCTGPRKSGNVSDPQTLALRAVVLGSAGSTGISPSQTSTEGVAMSATVWMIIFVFFVIKVVYLLSSE